MNNQKKVWENIAPSWNIYKKIPSPTVKNFLKQINGNILDLGCGSGRNFLKLKNSKIFAVDFSPKMIKYAKETANKKKINTSLYTMDASKLDFPDNFFNGILCWALLHCIKGKNKRKKILKEIKRTLKPNGKLLISCWGKKSPRLKNQKKECFVPWTIKENFKEKRYTYIYDLSELKKELKDTGFFIEKIWEQRNINAICQKVS